MTEYTCKGTTASFPILRVFPADATIAVHPENITMSRGGGMLEGTLTHRFYLGDAVDYRVTVGDHDVRYRQRGRLERICRREKGIS